MADNAARANGLIRQAAARGARYIVFPELAFLPAPPGVLGERLARAAEPVPGPLTEAMHALARELDVHLAFGMAERRAGAFYNTVVFVEPRGVVGVYAKRALIGIGPPGEVERELFAPGSGTGRLLWGGVPTGVLICADSGADQRWREVAAGGTRLLVWPKSSFAFTAKRAAEYARTLAVPVAVANTARPTHEHFWLFGGSAIFDAHGQPLATAGTAPDEIAVADVPLDEAKR